MRSEEIFEVFIRIVTTREADLSHGSDCNADKDGTKYAEADDDIGAQHRTGRCRVEPYRTHKVRENRLGSFDAELRQER